MLCVKGLEKWRIWNKKPKENKVKDSTTTSKIPNKSKNSANGFLETPTKNSNINGSKFCTITDDPRETQINDTLKYIQNSVGNLRKNAETMNKQITEQNEDLEIVNDEMTKVNDSVIVVNSKLENINKKNSNCIIA